MLQHKNGQLKIDNFGVALRQIKIIAVGDTTIVRCQLKKSEVFTMGFYKVPIGFGLALTFLCGE